MLPKHIITSILLVLVLVFGVSAVAQTYTIIDLGSLPTDTTSSANAISSTGQVVGGPAYGNFDPAPYGFRWEKRTGMHELGLLPGSFWSVAYGVNSLEQVVGFSGSHAFLWTGSAGMQDLGTLPGGTSSVARAINRTGKVVGSSGFAGGGSHAFYWTAATGMVDLGTLPGTNWSTANSVNNQGVIVGTSLDTTGGSPQHPCLWDSKGVIHDLGFLPGGYWGEGWAISNTGQVVGDSNSAATFWPHAFSWTNANGMIDLGTLPGDVWSDALSVNKLGQIVGYSANPTASHAVLWTSAGPQDLNKLIPANSRWDVLYLASGINDAGQIVGTGWITNFPSPSVKHAFLLTPVH